MCLSRLALSIFSAAACFSTAAHAATVFDTGITALSPGTPTQLGRLSRDGIPSDWSSTKTFPGIINPTTSYHFVTYALPILSYQFLQINVDDRSGAANIFVSAYLNSYDPSNKAANYLGDAGGSGNFFGVDPRAFQVIVPTGNALTLLVNDTSAAGAGVGQPYRILVEGFTSTDFNDVIPEPTSLLLSASGLGLVVVLFFSRSRHSAKQ